MKISVQIETDESQIGFIAMAEKWIEELVSIIKSRDGEIAEVDKAEERRAHIVQQDGPRTWKAFADFVVTYFKESGEAFLGHPTETPIEASFDPNRSPQLTLSKEAYPAIQLKGDPDFASQSAKLEYYTENPRLSKGAVKTLSRIPFRFEVSQQGKVFIQLDGTEFHDGKDAARHLIMKLLTLPPAPFKV